MLKNALNHTQANMNEIKRQRYHQQQQQIQIETPLQTTTTTTQNTRLSSVQRLEQSTISPSYPRISSPYDYTCSIIPTPTKVQRNEPNTSSLESCSPAESTHMTLLTLRRRRSLQRQACLLSILAAFVLGLVLGVLMPMFGLANIFTNLSPTAELRPTDSLQLPLASAEPLTAVPLNRTQTVERPPSDFPTIYEPRKEIGSASFDNENAYSVAFIQDSVVELTADQVFRNAFHLEQDKHAPDALIVKKLDADDGSIKEFRVQRTQEGRFRKGPERRISKPSLAEQVLHVDTDAGTATEEMHFVPMAQRIVENARNQRQNGIIKSDIYWGDLVEAALPKGFTAQDEADWNHYVATQAIVQRLEPGCGRMQNRLVTFADGTRACARYRQNTDQIQGELFSFYLGQLLNLSNLAPSATAVIDLESPMWSSALADITQAQWKQQRPIVLTRWLAELEPAGIPQPFQPLERHLNKYDVWNITLSAAVRDTTSGATGDYSFAQTSVNNERGLLKRLEAASSLAHDHQSTQSAALASQAAVLSTTTPVLQRLIELAQWSDLIVFDYLIANLDRVVNNLYNFQWNADIMAAPAHNLARNTRSQLLVFLDNESGLLHGYRLLKKYEAYHGLLLDNLCMFRQPTIEALRKLRAAGAGRKLRELFEHTADTQVRDVLPTLPDKSIKILVDRIDRVLGQVQKCRDLLTDR